MRLHRFKSIALAALLFTGVGVTPAQANYAQHPDAQAMIQRLVAEGFDEVWLRSTLAQAQRQDSILAAMDRPAERRFNWTEYRALFVEPQRLQQALEFWAEHEHTLARAEAEYGVPAEIIVSIIGVETRYGRIMGRHRVLDALATLGFDYPRRAEFFRGQLEDYLRLVREEGVEPGQLVGSYAGAMGYGQFIPSSFRRYAVDFDGDGKRDIWSNPVDAIGSVANYFREHGWKTGAAVRAPVLLQKPVDAALFNTSLLPEKSLMEWSQEGIATSADQELSQAAALLSFDTDDGQLYWFGLHNFYVITRYNHSRMYGMAVYEFSQAIQQARLASRS